MEKILLAMDATNPNMQALDFACYLGALTRSKITGVFLENLVADEKFVLQEMHNSNTPNWQTDKTIDEFINKAQTVEKNIASFKQACERRSTRHTVHRDKGVPAKEIIRESRYADILIVDAETSFNKRFEGTPTLFTKDILANAECPVIIAPENFEEIEEIVFTCDGSRSSLFAIKQFCYLFPELDDKKVTLVHVNEGAENEEEEKEQLKEWISSHYSSIGFETLRGDTETELLDYLLKKKNAFVVMGAYGRSMLSLFFKRSRAELLIKTITPAIFITHP
jgi:hypothetical protein